MNNPPAGESNSFPHRPQRRRLPIVVACILGACLSFLVFSIARRLERDRVDQEFSQDAGDLGAAWQRVLAGHLEALEGVHHFYEGSTSVEANEFASFTRSTFKSHPGLQALAWAPRVTAADFADHVKQAVTTYHLPPGYLVRDLAGQPRAPDAVPPPDLSIPIQYVEPFTTMRASLWGMDLHLHPECAAAMEMAAVHQRATATAPIALNDTTRYDSLVFVPLYEKAEPRVALFGYAVAILRVSEIQRETEKTPAKRGIELFLCDDTDPAHRQVLHPQGWSAQNLWRNRGGPTWQTSKDVGGRRWTLAALPTDEYLAPRSSSQPWWVLAASLLCTLLLAAYLSGALGRTARVEQLVWERTSQLAMANRALELEVADRKRAEEAAAANERRTRLIVDTALDAFVAMDSAGLIVDWNRNAEATFGWSRDEVLGKSVTTTLIPPRYRQAHNQGLQRFLATGTGPVLNKRIEVAALHRDGHEFPIELTISPAMVGSQYLFNAFLHNISSRKQAEAELQQAKVAAETANRAKSDFLANVSHEIRTPMNGIMGMTELALATDLNAEQREYLELVKSSSDHLLAVINDVLDFSKIEAGKMDLESIAFSPGACVEEALATLALRAHAKGLELACHVLEGVPDQVLGDPGRLRQVIVNLVGNAIKFTDRGEVVVQVARDETGRVDGVRALHFAVRDTGIGIPPDKLGVLFKAFSQVDVSTTRKYGGTGLGLAIAARLVQLMDGRIWVESNPGAGSTFQFTASFDLAAEIGPKDAQTAQPPLSGLALLVVDDNATNRGILSDVLTRAGAQATTAANGSDALAALERAQAAGKPFALVLVDAIMPEMDGFQLAERLREYPRGTSATVMMLSSPDRPADVQRCRALGLSTYLTKPIKQADLVQGIVTALQAARHPKSTATTVPTEQAPRSMQVLLVEDNAVNQRLALRVLEKRGHVVTIVNNGAEALELLGMGASRTPSSRFDVVLMDVLMPEMDGFETTRRIRAFERACGGHLPIVAMTAHALKGDREKCLAVGMDGYVGKPLNANELVRVVEATASTTDYSAASPGALALGDFDPEHALGQAGGDPKVLHELLGLFLASYPRSMTDMRRAIEQHDARGLHAAAHGLRGAAEYLAIRAVRGPIEQLETMGQTGQLAQAGEALDELELRLQRILPTLAAHVRPASAPA